MDQSSVKESFLQMFDAYSDAIFRFCMVKTSNKELSEDLTQEVFMRYWQALAGGREMTNTRSFLYTIAQNLIIDWYRKKKSASLDVMRESGYDPIDTGGPSTEDEATFAEICAVIEHLDEKDKEVLLLRYGEGLDPKDIAEIWNESANAVSVRINRALQKVRDTLHI